MKIHLIITTLILSLACNCLGQNHDRFAISDLRCESLSNPVGIDETEPRLSWRIESETFGEKQTAYHIMVASSPEKLKQGVGDLWDSGKVPSDQSVHVAYAGKPLESRIPCFWKVMVWDKDGKASGWSEIAHWRMGLLNPDDWTAEWIGAPLTVAAPTTPAGNNELIVKKATYRTLDGSVAVDVTAIMQRELAKKKPFTVHFKTLGGDPAPGVVKELVVDYVVNGKSGTARAKDFAELNLPRPKAIAGGNDAFVVKKATLRTSDNKVSKDVTEVMQKVLKNRSPYRVNFAIFGGDPAPRVNKELVVEYVADGKPGTEKGAGAKRIDLFKGRKKVFPPSRAPLFRKEFDLAAAPDSAIVTVHSPGYFEVYINGEKVGTDVLSPAVSRLDAQTFYVSYDVAPYLRPGKNCLGLWLGKGWADNLAVRAQLDAIVAGKPVTIGTDTSWQTRSSGLVRIGGWVWGDFGGERLDARELVPDWNQPGVNTDSWSAALPAKPPAGPVRSHPCPLNRIGETIPAVAVTPLEDGKYEIDFGVALTGFLRMKMPELEPGTVVTMTFADIRPEENLYDKRKNRKPDYQHFEQISEFISAGKPDEVFEHKFNFAAFRYVIIEGLPSAPAKEDATAYLVDSDLEDAGSFECSSDLFNSIHRVNKWTQRCLNLGGFYVDCPHRERMGYGDAQVATEGFMSNFRADRYYRKWLKDWRLVQGSDGNLKHSAPFGKGSGGPGWGGLLSAITWRHYLYYGDPRVLEENYDAIRRYVDFIETQCKEGVLRKYGRFIGDWVPPGRGMDSKNHPSTEAAEVFNNGYRLNQIELLTKMADVLGKTDDAARYRKLLTEARTKVHAALYNAKKQEYVIDEQAYYVMPLMTGITPEDLRPALLKKLEENILVKKDGHLDTGMLGTYFMMEYLREIDRNDLVFTMFNQTTYPSWGYMLEQGATTLWEQWNGYWSRVHSCFTSPDNWFYQGLGGIQADPAAPGFKHVIIKPAIVGDLTWVKTYHDSSYGRIVSNWQRDPSTPLRAGGDRLTMEIAIPANSTATVYVPAGSAGDVTVNGQPLKKAAHVTFLRMENGKAVLKVGSGEYRITSN